MEKIFLVGILQMNVFKPNPCPCLSSPRMTVEGVTFKIISLITAFKGNEEMDKTLRSSHAPSVLTFYQRSTSSNFYFYTASKKYTIK